MKTIREDLSELLEKLEDILHRMEALELPPPVGAAKKAARTMPPTVDEVAAYCLERKNNVNALAFVDFYEAKGWMIGKNKMKSWQAAVRTWEKRDNGNPPVPFFKAPPTPDEIEHAKRTAAKSIVAKDAAMARYLKEVGGT